MRRGDVVEIEGGFCSTTSHATHERPAAARGAEGIDVGHGRGIVGHGERKVGGAVCEGRGGGGGSLDLERLVPLAVEDGGALGYLGET